MSISQSTNVDEAIKECIHIRYSVIHNKFVQLEATDEDFRNLSDLFEKALKSSVCLFETLKNQSIFFNYFKLQDYSEYKKENRDSIINNLIN
jgi:hypothetical protein